MLNLKILRENQHLSQQKLANAIDVSRSTIAMWETGKSQPDNDALKMIADFFKVSVDYILGRENAPSPLEAPYADNTKLSVSDCSLVHETEDLTDGEREKILDYVRYIKSQRKK